MDQALAIYNLSEESGNCSSSAVPKENEKQI